MSVRWSTTPPWAWACSGLMYLRVPTSIAGVRQAQVAGEPRQAEVGDPECAIAIDQEVGRLDVAMDDAQAMGVVERIGSLDSQAGHIAAKGAVLVRRPARRGQ